MSDAVDNQRKGFTFIWKIENFSLITKLPKYETISSPVFKADNLSWTSWLLELRPVGYSESNKDSFFFTLYKVWISGQNCISLDYELSILSRTDGKEKSVTVRAFWFHVGNARGTPLSITPNEIFTEEGILPRDTLTIQCKMWERVMCPLYSDYGFSLGRTRISFERKSFVWTIDEFSTLQVNEAKSVSVEWQSKLKLSLTITIFLTGTPTYDETLRIKIEGNNKEKFGFIVRLGISVLNKNSKAVHQSEDEFKFLEEKEEWPFPLTVEKKHLVSSKDLLLPGDKLSLKCALVITKFSTPNSIALNAIECTTYGTDAEFDLKAALTYIVETTCPKNEVIISSNSLSNDMKHLFEEKYLSDINLRVRSEVIPVHKVVLAARSSVFKTMFDIDMKEKLTNIIEIDDIEPDTMRRLLLYIYSDTFESDIQWENVSSLCLAAEKYAVIGLKEKCCSFFRQNLSLTTVCEILILADILINEDLKDSALDFIEKNDKIVMNSNEWKHFAQKHPLLTVEILSQLYRNVKKF